MKLYKYLCNDEFRNGLAEHITEKVPELIECNPNNLNCVKIKEYNKPDGTGLEYYSWFDSKHRNRGKRFHTFFMILQEEVEISNTCHLLCQIDDDTTLDDIINVSKSHEWCYKMIEGLKYPNLGQKVKNIIIEYIRTKNLNRVL
jgi:hypothetical protein